MLKSTKLKEIYLFEMGEVKTLGLVKEIYSVFNENDKYSFVNRKAIIKLKTTENSIININLNNQWSKSEWDINDYFVKFINKRFNNYRPESGNELIINIEFISK